MTGVLPGFDIVLLRVHLLVRVRVRLLVLVRVRVRVCALVHDHGHVCACACVCVCPCVHAQGARGWLCNVQRQIYCWLGSAGPELLQMEPPEALERLRLATKVMSAFRASYSTYQKKSMTACPDRPWRFQAGALFARLDGVLERCRALTDARKTTLQFSVLERVEIGGTKVSPQLCVVHLSRL